MNRDDARVPHSNEIRPTRPIARDDERAVACKAWLKERFPRAPGHLSRVARRARLGPAQHFEQRPIPGHIRMVPGQESELIALRGKSRRGIEIMPRGHNVGLRYSLDDGRIGARTESNRDQAILWLSFRAGLFLDRDQPVAMLSIGRRDGTRKFSQRRAIASVIKCWRGAKHW